MERFRHVEVRARDAADLCAFAFQEIGQSVDMCRGLGIGLLPGSLDQTAMRSSDRRIARGGGRATPAVSSERIGAGDHIQRKRQSLAERASGPITEMSVIDATGASDWPRPEHSPQLGLWPNTPQ